MVFLSARKRQKKNCDIENYPLTINSPAFSSFASDFFFPPHFILSSSNSHFSTFATLISLRNGLVKFKPQILIQYQLLPPALCNSKCCPWRTSIISTLNLVEFLTLPKMGGIRIYILTRFSGNSSVYWNLTNINNSGSQHLYIRNIFLPSQSILTSLV